MSDINATFTEGLVGGEQHCEMNRDALEKGAFELVKNYDDQAEQNHLMLEFTGHKVFPAILAFIESFEAPDRSFDEDGFEQWLSRSGAKPHGNGSNVFQRCAKVFSAPSTSRALQSKRGRVLWAMREMQVRSIDALCVLSNKGPDPETGETRSGLARFEAFYRDRHSAFRGLRSVGEKEANSGTASTTESALATVKNLIRDGAISALIEGRRVVVESAEVDGDRLMICFTEASAVRNIVLEFAGA